MAGEWTADQIKELHDRDIQAAREIAAANDARIETRLDGQERAVDILASTRHEQRDEGRDNRGAAIALAGVLVAATLLYTNSRHHNTPVVVEPTVTVRSK